MDLNQSQIQAGVSKACNILGHDLDTQLFYDTLGNTVQYFPDYVEAVTKYINKG